jgi:hypothetical protein
MLSKLLSATIPTGEFFNICVNCVGNCENGQRLQTCESSIVSEPEPGTTNVEFQLVV